MVFEYFGAKRLILPHEKFTTPSRGPSRPTYGYERKRKNGIEVKCGQHNWRSRSRSTMGKTFMLLKSGVPSDNLCRH